MGWNRHKQDSFNSDMTLGDHLEELRFRIILALIGLCAAVIVSLFFGKAIILFVEKPYIAAMGPDARLQTLAPADGFTSYMSISLITGLVVSSPWIFYQLWMFIATGLYPHEKRYINLAVPCSAVLFIIGALVFLLAIAPITLKFLVMFNKEFLGAESNFTFQNYMSFIGIMMLVFGLSFQTPIAIFFLNKAGLISIETLHKSRKFVIFGIVVAAAAVIPGSDIVSLLAMAIPVYFLFELGIFASYWASRKKSS